MKFLLATLTSIAFTASSARTCTTGKGGNCLGMKADSAKVASQRGDSPTAACIRDYTWANYIVAYLCEPSGDYACGSTFLGSVRNGSGDFQGISLDDTCVAISYADFGEKNALPALRGSKSVEVTDE